MAKAGWKVTVLEKLEQPGGRARQLQAGGFSFDMGPSWYWMPDVFERFFQQFGKRVSDYYDLVRLDPSYRIYWQDDATDIPADYNDLKTVFEKLEPGSSDQLDKFLTEAAYKYKAGMQKLVYKPGLSGAEFFDADLLMGILRLDVFTSVKKHVSKYFKNPKIRQMLEFPVLFLGAVAEKMPALYTLMNYADIKGGTWFPKGGMYSVVDAMYQLAVECGVHFHFNHEVLQIEVANDNARRVIARAHGNRQEAYEADVIIGNADYHHIESKLLPANSRNYSEAYWNKRVMAPGCILFYVGLNKKLRNIVHHSLFFDTSFDEHASDIYTTKQWPANPLFYVSATSCTDDSLAPPGHENLFFLIPVAAGLDDDTDERREYFFNKIVDRYESRIGETIRENIVFKRSFAYSDFVNDYHAFKGNAYGLANTLRQTAILKPSMKNKKLKNFFYTGQLTVPGPGVPPAIISGEVVAKYVINEFS